MAEEKPEFLVEEELLDAELDDERPVGAEESASVLLEGVAEASGFTLHRLGSDLLECARGEQRTVFRGLAGGASGKVGHALCANDGWLRRHLAGRGLPVTRTNLVDLADADFACEAAVRLGFPSWMRLMADGATATPAVATDLESFLENWQRFRALTQERSARVVIEEHHTDEAVEVAVVGDAVIAASTRHQEVELSPAAQQLAAAAIAALPGVAYGSVRLLLRDRPTGDGATVSAVDPTFAWWVDPPHQSARDVAKAVLSVEFPGPDLVDAGSWSVANQG